MKITIDIHYITHGEEHLSLLIGEQNIALQPREGGIQTAEIEIEGSVAEYSFAVMEGDRIARREWGAPHRLTLPTNIAQMKVREAWHDAPICTAYSTSLFTEGVSRLQCLRAGVLRQYAYIV